MARNYTKLTGWLQSQKPRLESLRKQSITAFTINMASNQTIAIFGSRDIDRNSAYVLFDQHLSSFLSQGGTWVLGGSRGLEQWAIQWLLDHNERVRIVLAYTRNVQPAWLHPLLDEVDRVIELRLPKRKTASAIRNRHSVELAQVVFGFWSGKGGSIIKTLKHALTKRREVHGISVVSQEY